MNFLHDIYEKGLFENEKNIRFWENYLQNLDSLDLNGFAEKLTVPVLVPIGTRILFRGELKHTNEVTVALSPKYFAKCSINQAEILRQHRIKNTKSKLVQLKLEREYLQSQVMFKGQALEERAGCDVIEVVTEEEDKAWREKHRDNVRQYKQRKDKSDDEEVSKMTNHELWERLDELELQEELENELATDINEKHNAEELPTTANADDKKHSKDDDDADDITKNIAGPSKCDENNDAESDEVYSGNCCASPNAFQQPPKLELFEKVVNRHNAIKQMVAEMKSRMGQITTEDDLERRLHELEVLEILEDEMAILEDILASDDDDDIEVPEEEEDADNEVKKSVAFADVNDSKTFEITFRHSKVEPSKTPYDTQKGITKPSDIREAHSSCSSGQTTSILKKPKCVDIPKVSKTRPSKNDKQGTPQDGVNLEPESNTILVGNVVEKDKSNDSNVKPKYRPMSLFKKRRQQNKE